ncbi:universal stress protein [Anderseniella sp. Alg231-50]|uniref:universal stress protein n=1 Tax=Anderseniella sp. Alg231-50 TaxID=1922226 RepID=UPI00307BB5B9
MRRFRKILYVHEENSPTALQTLQLALNIAGNSDGKVDLLTVLEPPAVTFASNISLLLQSRWVKESEEQLQQLAGTASPEGSLNTKVIEGRPHIQVVREVLRHDYDLVIKPIGPSGFLDKLFGRLDMRLLRSCPCPVWLSKGETYGAFDNVLAAVDADVDTSLDYLGGEPPAKDALNRQILELAFSLCADNSARLHVGHAWYPPFLSPYSRARANVPQDEIDAYVTTVKRTHTGWLKRLMNDAAGWAGEGVADSVHLKTHLPQGDPETEIPKLVSDVQADLVIMGTVARTGVSGLVMGNTAETILDQISCSVLAVKPSGFVSGVTLDE